MNIFSGLAAVTTAAVLVGMMTTPAFAASQSAPIKLGAAATFSVLAHAAATLPGSTLPSEVGAGAAITIDSNTHFGPAGKHAVNDTATQTALSALAVDYSTLSSLTATGTLSGDDLTGQTVTPGVYHRVAAYAMTTPVTFDAQGDTTANFVMQSDAALNTTAGTTMNLINGAQASHIFWVTRGAATLGASSHFFGTMVSYAAITVGASSTVCGRALSVTAAVTLDADVYSCTANADEVLPTIAITSPNTSTTTTPRIIGTSTAPDGSAIDVTTGSFVVHTTVGANGTKGAWAVDSPVQNSSPVSVIAKVTDPGGYTATAYQTLTITSPPAALAIAITSSPSAVTPTPLIKGTSNAKDGSGISVTVDGQTLTATVVGGGWNVTPAPLATGTYPVVATVTDLSGKMTSTSQNLTVTLAATALAIAIRSGSSTTTATPTIAGTSNAADGSSIVVTVGGQTLNTTVVNKAWSVITSPLRNGSFAVVATVTDSLAHTAKANTQLPVNAQLYVVINGGPVVNTNTHNPIITGWTNASTVCVTVNGATACPSIDNNGNWSTVVGPLANGTYTVTAVITGNCGCSIAATQILKVCVTNLIITINAGSQHSALCNLIGVSGTTNAAIGSSVVVTISNQSFTKTVTVQVVAGSTGNEWSVVTSVPVDGVYSVTASVTTASGTASV